MEDWKRIIFIFLLYQERYRINYAFLSFFFNTSIAFDRVIISHRIAGSAPARACKQLRHLQVVSIERPDLLYTKSAKKLDIEGINGPFFSYSVYRVSDCQKGNIESIRENGTSTGH